MRCPITPELWQQYRETGDIRVAQHLATCAQCRAESERFTALQTSLAALPVYQAPATVSTRLQELAAATQGQEFGCRETLAQLEAWRDGELPAAQAFLVEDHLLWCVPCHGALEQAEAVTAALHCLPRLEAPAAVAERVARGRIPWWQRLLPAPAPSLSRQFSYAVATMAAALLLVLGSTLLTPTTVEQPIKSGPVMATIMPSPAGPPALPNWPEHVTMPPVPPVKPSFRPVPRHRIKEPTVSIESITRPAIDTSQDPTRPSPTEVPAPPAPTVIASAQTQLEKAKMDNDLTDTDNTRDACINAATLDSSHTQVMVVGL